MLRMCLFGSNSTLGGTEVYLRNLIMSLKGVVVFDYLVNHKLDHIPFENEIIACGGKIYYEYYMLKERGTEGYLSSYDIIKKHPEWDGVYINLQQINTAYELLIAAKKCNLKYRIMHSHSQSNTRQMTIKDSLYKYYFKLTQNRVLTHRFACSEEAGKFLFGKKDCLVIPNVIVCDDFRYDQYMRKNTRNRLNIRDEEKIIGYLGRLSFEKNPLFMLDILKCIKDESVKLLMVGSGPLEDEIKLRCEKYNLTNRVIFIKETNTPNAYYQAMDFFVCPSLHEGFGIVLLEAQSSGLLCMAAKNRVPAETNITGNIAFMDSLDKPEIWAEGIMMSDFKRKDEYIKIASSKYNYTNFKNTFMRAIGENLPHENKSK